MSAHKTLEESFCKHCGTLLKSNIIDENGTNKIVLQCSNCTYKQDVEQNYTIQYNSKINTQTSMLDMATLYDPAIKRSCKVKCPSTECDANNPESWGLRNKSGILIQPDTMIVNYNDINRVSTFICRVCNKTHRPSNL